MPYWPESYGATIGDFVALQSARSPAHELAVSSLSYQLAPRAKIFRRDQASVVDMDSMKALMRSNNYRTDPYANGSPWNAICSRGDLASSPSAGGCYDTKVSCASWMSQGRMDVVNGPTTNGGSLPPFAWTAGE